MTAIWKWYSSPALVVPVPINQFDSQVGFMGFVVNAPESLQRVILRGFAQGAWYGVATTEPPRPASPPQIIGSINVELSDDTGYYHQLAIIWVPTSVSGYASAVVDGPAGPQQEAGCQWSSRQEIVFDTAVRRAAPPPPSSGLTVNFTGYLSASRTEADLEQPDWSGLGHGMECEAWYLTSQPGP